MTIHGGSMGIRGEQFHGRTNRPQTDEKKAEGPQLMGLPGQRARQLSCAP